MACWHPKVHRDEDNQDVQTALTQLRSWEEDDPNERLRPPHIVAAISLSICLCENVGLVLDTVPDVASLWKPEFDAIEKALRELIHKYKNGAEDYKASLESTCILAYQAKRMLKRLESKVPGESGVPNGTSVDTPGNERTDSSQRSEKWRRDALAGDEEEQLSVEDAAGYIKMSGKTIYRMMDEGMPYMQPRDKPKSHRRIWKSDLVAWRADTHPNIPQE